MVTPQRNDELFQALFKVIVKTDRIVVFATRVKCSKDSRGQAFLSILTFRAPKNFTAEAGD
jgi:hypothetical protein